MDNVTLFDIVFFCTYFKVDTEVVLSRFTIAQSDIALIRTLLGGDVTKIRGLSIPWYNQYLSYLLAKNVKNVIIDVTAIRLDRIAKQFKCQIARNYSTTTIPKNEIYIKNGSMIYGTNVFVNDKNNLNALTIQLHSILNTLYTTTFESEVGRLNLIINGELGYIFESPIKDWNSYMYCNKFDETVQYPLRLYLLDKDNKIQNALNLVYEQMMVSVPFVVKNYYGGLELIEHKIVPYQRKRLSTDNIYEMFTEQFIDNCRIWFVQPTYIFDFKAEQNSTQLTELLELYQPVNSIIKCIVMFNSTDKPITNDIYVNRYNKNSYTVNTLSSLPNIFERFNVKSFIFLPKDVGIPIKGTSNAFMSPKFGICLFENHQIFNVDVVIDEHSLQGLGIYSLIHSDYKIDKLYHITNEFYLYRSNFDIKINILSLVKIPSTRPVDTKIKSIEQLDNILIKNSLSKILYLIYRNTKLLK
jgi:hypothetical protein